MTAEREILAERVTDEAVVGQDAPQIVVTFEHDAKQVKGLALEPVGRVPDVIDRGQHRHLVIRHGHPHAQALVETDRQQVDHDTKTGAIAPAALVIRVVNTAQVDQLLKLATRRVTQQQRYGQQVGSINHQTHLATGHPELTDFVAHDLGHDLAQSLRINGENRHRGFLRHGLWFGCGGFSAATA